MNVLNIHGYKGTPHNAAYGTLEITGGSITGNKAGAGGNGGGISYSGGTISLSGSPVITGNTEAGGSSNDLFIWNPTDRKLAINGNLSSSAKIGVRLENNATETPFTTGLSGKGTYSNFVSNYDDRYIRLNGSGEAIFKTAYTITVA